MNQDDNTRADSGPGPIPVPSANGRPPDVHPSQLVTLDQIAARAIMRKRSLERYVRRMPPPYRPGSPGRPALWAWADVRPWLVETFGLIRLPERLPNIRL